MGGRGNNANSPTSPTRLRARERDLQALALRARGLSFAEIGDHLGVAKQTAHDAVSRGLALRTEEIRERADALRAIETERLNAAAEAIWPMVERGDLRAQDVWLRNRGRFAALLNLDLRPAPNEGIGPQIIVTSLPSDRPAPLPVVQGTSWDVPALPEPASDE